VREERVRIKRIYEIQRRRNERRKEEKNEEMMKDGRNEATKGEEKKEKE
jgi:hypothetical protein